jgi:hypothetical protein
MFEERRRLQLVQEDLVAEKQRNYLIKQQFTEEA